MILWGGFLGSMGDTLLIQKMGREGPRGSDVAVAVDSEVCGRIRSWIDGVRNPRSLGSVLALLLFSCVQCSSYSLLHSTASPL